MGREQNTLGIKRRRFRPYPEYKYSGVEWLGKIPAHWDTMPIRSLARPGYKTFVDGDWIESPFIRAEGIRLIQTGNVGIGVYKEQGFRYIDEETFHSFHCTEVFPRDLLICRLADPVGRACQAPDLDHRMITSVDVCILKTADDIDAPYVVYTLSGEGYLSWLGAICRGGTRDRVSRSMLGSIPIQKPPLREQRAISTFLDRETARIDALIEKKERLIELLQEKRAALITQAVTRGLDPAVPMKDSGVEWIGEIPEHWQARRIAMVAAKITNGYVGPTRDIFVNEGIRYLQSLHIKNGLIDFERHPYFVTADWSHEHEKSILAEGDILVVQTGGIGQVAVVPKEFIGCNCHALIIIRLKRGLGVGAWIARSLESDYGQQALGWSQTGALHPHLECGFVREIRIALPPPDEQTRILKDLENLLAKHDALSAKIQEAIARLKEYRTALISALVTGKVEMPELA